MNDTSMDHNFTQFLLKDRKSDRRWRNVRFFGWMIILLLYAFLIFGPSGDNKVIKKPYVSLVRLTGIIMPGTGFSAQNVIPELQEAFSDHKAKGVVLLINSPGGSPVQASIIHDKIIELKKEFHKKVIVVGEDAIASGGYLVATAGDKIYVSPDSLTGSIGVVMSGFGFTDAIKKLGITRRLFTAGDHKDRLDPFEPLNEQDVFKVKHVLNQVHQNFINDVLQGRGDRLRGNKAELFSGDFWTGEEAVQLGIADGTADLWVVLKEEFGVAHFKDYTPRPSFIKSLFREAKTFLDLHLMDNTSPLREQ